MKKGFTLIELLVVISIIGLLAGLVTVSFTTAQKQTRDAVRKSDIKQYSTSLETYANSHNGFYPMRNATVPASTTLCADLSMTNCPVDPKYAQDNSYIYNYQSDGTASNGTAAALQYVLWAKLENVSTATYWVACSNGKLGTATSGIPPTGGTCPI